MTQPAASTAAAAAGTEPATGAATTASTGEPTAQNTGAAAQGAKAPEDKGPAGGDRQVLADLAKERDARQALEKQVAALAPLAKLADALGVQPAQGKTDVETLTATVKGMQDELAKERIERVRLEVAAEKGLTVQQAARLHGANREELAADADALKALFPSTGQAAGTTATGQPGTPAPDPSQGARGGANDIHALIAEAEKKGDVKESIRLKNQLLRQQRT